MALWRVVDDDDDVILSSPVAGYQSYSPWTAGLHSPSDDDDDDELMLASSGSGPAMTRPLATTRRTSTGGSRGHDRPLHVPLYYRMKPVSVKPCEKAEKVRAFAYNDIRQVTIASLKSINQSIYIAQRHNVSNAL